MTAHDIELYLQSHQRPKYQDPKQRWISTHNMRAVTFIKFFRWLYFPDLPAKNRPKPDVIKNVVAYQKPEATNIEAKDLWMAEEDRIFLKYCLDPRIAWYHTASDDTSGRPHEILAKRFVDVKIKTHEGKMFGEMEIGRGGKTEARTVPLIRSLPYFKALAGQNTDPQSYIFRANRNGMKERNKPITVKTLGSLYGRPKREYFPQLLERPDVPPEDKDVIRGMLQKP